MARGQLIAEGTFQYLSGDVSSGRETWQISQLGHGGIIISSQAEFTAPLARGWSFTFELSRAWAPVQLTIRSERNGAPLITNQRVEGDRWVAEVEGAGAERATFELPFSAQHEIDFGSVLFNTVTLLRTVPQMDQPREFDVIFIDSESLAPLADRQRYQMVGEEKIQVPAGNFRAFKYEMLHPNQSEPRAYEFWADRHGVILRYPALNLQLARYRRK